MVIVQFVADTLFKTLVVVPVLGGLVLVALVAGGNPLDVIDFAGLTQTISAMVSVLLAHPIALAAFLTALGVILAGGSVLMFAVKAGSVTILLAGDRTAGLIEEPPLRFAAVRQANQATLERFTDGVKRLFPRYLRLGIALTIVYGVIAAVYLAAAALLVARDNGWPLLALSGPRPSKLPGGFQELDAVPIYSRPRPWIGGRAGVLLHGRVLDAGWQAATRASTATKAGERMSRGMGENRDGGRTRVGNVARVRRASQLGQRFVRGSGRTVRLLADRTTQPVVHGVHCAVPFYTGRSCPYGAERCEEDSCTRSYNFRCFQ